jgi:hypothetical protein
MSGLKHNPHQFTVLIKNIGTVPIVLPEIGGFELSPDEEIDMCDPELPNGHYGDPGAVLRALNDLSGTVLYRQREAGNLTYRIEPQ